MAELICAVAFSIISLWHEGRSRVHAFDVMLQGRSDSLLGAIQDAEDPGDNVTIDPRELRLPSDDIYAVYNAGGRLVGASASAPAVLVRRQGDGIRTMDVGRRHYRVLEREALRIIDRAETHGVGLRRPVTIIYAAPTDHLWREVIEAAGFYIVLSLVLICLTAVILIVTLRKLISPIKELAKEAIDVQGHTKEFTPPQSALKVKELRPLAEALAQTIRKLQLALHMQHRFLSDAAHELKTAVAVERSTVQLLALRSRTTEEYSEGLVRILEDNERLEQLVGRMLTLARFEEQGTSVSEGADLGRSVQKTVDSLQQWIEARGIHLSVEMDENVRVPLAEEAAEILVSNLLMNAVQHSASGTQVSVSVRVEDESCAVLKTKDAGGGISPGSLPHVFDRFYREDRSRSRATGGAGLGLAICKSIVEGADGSIGIESAMGQGTTVTAKFPLVREKPYAPAAAALQGPVRDAWSAGSTQQASPQG
ncbi:MAG TPA: HAMP domain-containing sensor histidine kinase [Bryocella sp.]|nr:HAMP domain-containing sensor histidine kinase [Bryocella sp.]